MKYAVTKHEGKCYLLLEVRSTWQDTDTAHVCVVDLTPAVIADWGAKIQLATELKAQHGIIYIAFDDDHGPQWRVGDWGLQDVDFPGPAWTVPPARTEVDRLEVEANSIDFTCFGKHTDERLTATLWARNLPAIEAKLNDLTVKE